MEPTKIIPTKKSYFRAGNEDDLRNLEELALLKTKVKQLLSEEKVGRQWSHHDSNDWMEPITEFFKETIRNLFPKSRATIAPFRS